MVRVENNHSEFYYQMFKDIDEIHKIFSMGNKEWMDEYRLYKIKLEKLEELRDYYLIKCWKVELTDVYNTFLKATTNCKIKMNRYSQLKPRLYACRIGRR